MRKPRQQREPRRKLPGARAAVDQRRDINAFLFDNGLRHSYIKRLKADPDLGKFVDTVQATYLNPADQARAIASVPLAHKAERLAAIGSLYSGLMDIRVARMEACAIAVELGQPLRPGMATGLMLEDGRVDADLIKNAAALIRLAAEEMGEVSAGATSITQVAQTNVFTSADLGAVVSVLCGNVPPMEEK